MKKLIIPIILLIVLVGCSSKTYTKAVDNATDELKKDNYAKAVNILKDAKDEKNTDEVKQDLKAANLLNKSKNAFDDGNFDESASDAKKVAEIDSDNDFMKLAKEKSKALKKEASGLASQKKVIEDNIEKANKLLKQNRFDEAYVALKNVPTEELNTDNKVIADLKARLTDLINQVIDAKKEYNDNNTNQNSNDQNTDETDATTNDDNTTTQSDGDNQDTSNAALTQKEAEKLVRQHLGLQGNSKVHVEYDHKNSDGDFIVHVYEVVIDNPETKEGHTATWGWYGVDKDTKKVYDAMN